MKQMLGITEEQDKGAGMTEESITEEKAEQEALFTELTPAMLEETYDLVCIGSGPAGASAAVY